MNLTNQAVKELSARPILLNRNRVQRFYKGGKLLDRWQGIRPETDGFMSEEFLVSTIEYIGPKKDLPHHGLSCTTLTDGSVLDLKSIIAADPKAFLGGRYAPLSSGNAGVLARAGDALVRLMLQVHPDGAAAQKYLGQPAGKTEAWVILDTRSVNGEAPCFYAGFKEGITKEQWRALFDRQDLPGMLSAIHRIEAKKGDVVIIPAGMPHAMGPGCLFLELHEPCDYTFRPERNSPLSGPVSDYDMHYGIGFDALFDVFHYKNYSDEQIRKKICLKEKPLKNEEGGCLYDIITYEDTDRFAARRLILHGSVQLPEFDGHYLIIPTKGTVELTFSEGSVSAPQGQGVFVPAGVKNLSATGTGEVILAYPFQTDGGRTV